MAIPGFRNAQQENDWENEKARLNADAHERAMARRRRTLEISPGAGSPWEYKALVGDYRQQRDANNFRAHEMKMLDQQGKNELAVAEQKKLGMIGQGADAANHNANATVEAAKVEAEAKKYGFDTQKEIESGHDATALTTTEKKMSGEQSIATTQAEAHKSVAETKAEAEKKIAEANQQTALAQQAMTKYKIDSAAAQNVAKMQQQIQGKDSQSKVAIIKQAVANGQLDPNAALQMIDEINGNASNTGNNTGSSAAPRPMGKWAR